MTTTNVPLSDPAKAADLLSNAWARTFIAEVTVALFFERDDGTWEVASGIFFKARGRRFVITAQHFVRGRNPTKICIPKRNGKEKLRTIGTCHLTHPEDPTLDVAVIELLKDETIAALELNAKYVTTKQMGLMDVDASAYLCGYPAALMKVSDSGVIEGKQFFVRTWFRRSVGPDLLNPPIEGLEMFLFFDKTGLSETGAELQTPKLEGMSGCGVWQAIRRDGGIWTSDSDLRLIGVQHSYKHDEFCRAISWSTVHDCFTKLAPDVAKDIWEAVFPVGVTGSVS